MNTIVSTTYIGHGTYMDSYPSIDDGTPCYYNSQQLRFWLGRPYITGDPVEKMPGVMVFNSMIMDSPHIIEILYVLSLR